MLRACGAQDWRAFAPPRNLPIPALGAANPIFRSVGLSYVQGTVRGPAGAEATVRFLIDSGATYSLLPDAVWRAIGLVPKREMEFVLADGTSVHRSVSECYLALPQGEGHSPVVLGQPGDAERSEEHTSELQSPDHLVCRLLLEKKNDHLC